MPLNTQAMSLEPPNSHKFRHIWSLLVVVGVIILCPLLMKWQGMMGVYLAVALAFFLVSVFTNPLVVFMLYFGALFFKDTKLQGMPVSINQVLAPLFFLSTFVYWIRGKANSPRFSVFPMLAVVVLYFVISGATGEDMENGLTYGLYAIIYLLLACGVGMVLSSERMIYAFCWIIVTLTAVSAVQGFFEALDKNLLNFVGHHWGSKTRISGPSANSVVFGWNLVYAFPFAFFLFSQMRSAYTRMLALGLGLFIMAIATLTFNRQTYVMMAIVIGLCAVLYSYKNRKTFLTLLSGLGVIGVFTVFPSVLRRLLTVTDLSKDYSYLERRDAFLMGLEMFKAHPLTGVGFGSYSIVWNQYIPPDYSTYFMQYRGANIPKFMDMAIFNLFAETGLIGFALFATLMIVLYRHGWKQYRMAAKAGDLLVRNLAATVLVVLTFFLTSSFIQDTFLYTRIWILYGVAFILDPRVLQIEVSSVPAEDKRIFLESDPAELPNQAPDCP